MKRRNEETDEKERERKKQRLKIGSQKAAKQAEVISLNVLLIYWIAESPFKRFQFKQ